MKPQLLKMSVDSLLSFSVRHDIVPYFFNKWHYHAEVELLHIEKGSGTQFIGDNISRFTEGDILMIGSNLPHYWRCDENYFENNPELFAEARVTHFLPDFWGNQYLDLPENKLLKELLTKANSGIKITGNTNRKVAEILKKLTVSKTVERIILLIEALHIISISKDIETIATSGFQNTYNESETERLNDIYKFTMSNFDKKISLEEISSIAHISPNSFCRYFKTQTKKTYSQFLMEIKIGNACKLLIENKKSISCICYESGFNNFSNFNRYFKSITGKSPLQYKKTFTKEHGNFDI
jgi:AraC-like DNA-binding protein